MALSLEILIVSFLALRSKFYRLYSFHQNGNFTKKWANTINARPLLICSYCQPAEMECKSDRTNANLFSANVGRNLC
ncbi:hypothetical protein EHW66_07270 [Erwinia psidii]|uniref:Uncharacterized protein n=1 Tax=Erwinia psidii TaxID=69224 RepID=A0A3N6S126_9GAMM|nr:hypothetical protein [Erwinia psidii]MCX8964813.1 hypothetical protein [Erwinia psidii]RQM38507.1 hypothetical protein EB241_09820 [Erwinia psidii]